MQTLVQDLRFAWRQMRQAPGFAILAAVTLALGIGANTAMFTVIENVFLRPLPYANPDRLVYVGRADSNAFESSSWLEYRDLRDQAQTLEMAGAYSEDVGMVESKGASVSVLTPEVTPNLFRMLGVRPLLGRSFTEAEGSAGGPQAVLISDGLWQQVFGRDPNVVGRPLRVNGITRTVVGVMPRSFRFPESLGRNIEKGVWLPLQPTAEMLKDRGYRFLIIVAELKPGATLAKANAELASIAQRTRPSESQSGQDMPFRLTPYHEMLTGPIRTVFVVLSAALALVLLIACANVANLLIARCLGRQQEFAVRAALGAGRRHLIRQVIAEGALLSTLGCALGVVLAYAVVWMTHKLPPDTIPRSETIEIHWTIMFFLGAIATSTTILSSLLPALFVAKTSPQRALQAAPRGTTTTSLRSNVRGWLVAGEAALSAMLLVSTGLLFRTLWNLEHARLGFDVTCVTSLTATPPNTVGWGNLGASPAPKRIPNSVATAVYKPVLDNLRDAPGVWKVALITAPPFSGMELNASFFVGGRPKDRDHVYEARLTAVSGDYGLVMGTPLVRGRELTDYDSENAPYVVVVNEALAREYFPGQDPLGEQIDLGGQETGMLKRYRIVGIIADQVEASPSQPVRPLLMLPYQQIPVTSLFYPALLNTLVHFVVKTRGNFPVAPEIRSIFRRTAPEFAVDGFETMQQAVDQSNFNARLGLYLIGTFAGLAVLMVMAGLYGVLAQSVSDRRREIGVRLALGATPQHIRRMVLRQGSSLMAMGLAGGFALSLCTSRLAKTFLYGVKPIDVATYIFVFAALFSIGVISAWMPARRAASVDPAKTLRE
jgi:putative ABC transport system permease protein